MLNLVQHLIKSITYETLKQVQGDKLGLLTSSSQVQSLPSRLVFLREEDNFIQIWKPVHRVLRLSLTANLKVEAWTFQ